MNDYDNCIFACLHLYVTFFNVYESYNSENQLSNTLLVSRFNYHDLDTLPFKWQGWLSKQLK